jgi:hypothetical protein
MNYLSLKIYFYTKNLISDSFYVICNSSRMGLQKPINSGVAMKIAGPKFNILRLHMDYAFIRK